MNKCKRCLLYEAGETAAFDNVAAYLLTLSDELKVADSEYAYRLSFCKKCDYLIKGMCVKCGCYVEVRAALKNKHCADSDSALW